MKTLTWLAAAATTTALIGCAGYGNGYAGQQAAASAADHAAAASAVAPACFYTRDIRNHTVGDAHTLYLNVNGRDVYRVEMTGACLSAATSSDPLIIRNPPGSNNVCRAIDLDVGVNVAGSINHCIVGAITPMTPAEVAALPAKLRP